MKILSSSTYCSLALGLIAGLALLAAAPASGTPSDPAATPPGIGFAHAQTKAHHACLSPLIQGSGGLCCPGLPSSASPCLRTNFHAISADVGKLHPIYVNGFRLPLPIALQMVKKALSQPSSVSLKDRKKLLCRKLPQAGSHFSELRCFTVGKQHLKAEDKKVHCYMNCLLSRENLAISVLRYVNNDSDRARLLNNLLAKVPAGDANYTLRVPERVPLKENVQGGSVNLFYPLFVTFVVQNGGLVDVQMEKRPGVKPSLVRNLKRVESQRAPQPPTRVDRDKGSMQGLCTTSNIKC
ncbi:MAG: hypothetical protein ACRES9_02160 [Gammaproteobacteria bacterium]